MIRKLSPSQRFILVILSLSLLIPVVTFLIKPMVVQKPKIIIFPKSTLSLNDPEWVFRPSDKVIFTLELNEPIRKQSFLSIPVAKANGKAINKWEDEDLKIQAKPIHNGREVKDIDVEIQQESNNKFSLTVRQAMNRKLVPGDYALEVQLENSDGDNSLNKDFTWGVLAINTNKSVYTPGEKAYLQMASLDKYGHTICDANLELEVTNPQGNVTRPAIQRSDTCGPDNVTDSPDYFTYYSLGEGKQAIGAYRLTLKNKENNYLIKDSFEVKESVPFIVERVGATRINPFKAEYTMNIKITANEDFTGEAAEQVPVDFGIKTATPVKFSADKQGSETISWTGALQKGQSTTLSYTYEAPRISPELFQLGPLKLYRTEEGSDQKTVVFTELRQWQIASDGSCAVTGSGTWDGAGSGTATFGAGCTGTSGRPGSGDSVTINAGITLTVSGTPAFSLASITMAGNGSTLTINGSVALTLTSALTLNSLVAASTTGTVSGAGSLSVASVAVGTDIAPTAQATTTLVSTISSLTSSGALTIRSDQYRSKGTDYFNNGKFQLESGTTTVNGSLTTSNIAAGNTSTLTMTTGAQSGTLVLGNATPWTISGTGTSTTTLNGASATVNYSGAGQTVRNTNYTHLTLSGSGTPTLTGVTSTGGNFTTSGTVTPTLPADFTVSGDLTIGSGTTLTSSSGTLTLGGSFTNSGTFTHNSGTVTFDSVSSNLTINSGNSSFYNVTFTTTTKWVAAGKNGNPPPGTGNIAFSSDGITWSNTLTNPFSSPADAGYAVAWNGTRWVAGGESTNALAYSSDGITWSGLGASTLSTGRGVAWNGTRWVAGGAGNNTLAYSSDGITWSGLGTSIFSTSGYGVAWNGTRWVAGGAGTNTLAYSSDGLTWSGLGTSIFTTGYGVAWNGTRWVAVGVSAVVDNSIAYSSDGITWTKETTSVFNDDIGGSSGSSVAWNGTRWVAVGGGLNNTLAYSSDGLTWSGLGASVFSATGYAIAWNGTRWVAVGAGTNTLAYSSDGLTWSGLGTSIFNTDGSGVASELAPELTPAILSDVSWTFGANPATIEGDLTINSGTVTFPSTTLTLKANFTNNGTFTHNSGTVAFNATDTGNTIDPGDSSFYNVSFTETERLIAAGNGTNSLAYSSDGLTWSGLGTSIFTTGTAAAWNGTRWVATGADTTDTLAYSSDGITWSGLGTSIFGGITSAGNDVAWNGTRWVAGGKPGNTLAYSSDGITWSGLGASIFTSGGGTSVAWNGTRWVATGNGGTDSLAYSSDGITWSGLGNIIFTYQDGGQDVAWNGTRWVAAGEGADTLAYSSDGITWSGLGTPVFSTEGYAVAWNGTRWVAAGSGTNTLAYSSDGITWSGLGAGIFTGSGYGIGSAPAPQLTPAAPGMSSWTFGANSATVVNNFTINGGEVTAPSTTLTIGGNFTNDDTFTHNSGTVTLNASSVQTISGSSTTTFYNLSVIGSQTVTINGGTTLLVADSGTLTLTGGDPRRYLTLQSNNGSDWNLQVSNTGTTVSVTNVRVSRSNASSYKTIDASSGNNINNGNNTNWTFGTAPAMRFEGIRMEGIRIE